MCYLPAKVARHQHPPYPGKREHEETMDDTSGNLDDIVPGVIFENASLFLGEILAGGTSANRPGPKGFRPLHDAAAYGHLDCVRVLLDHQGK